MPAPASPTSQHLPLLWPDDARRDGYFYGWLSPVVCVAGVLDVNMLDQAHNLLGLLCREIGAVAMSDLCGSSPVVLGRCSFANSIHPKFYFEDVTHNERQVIYYKRPNLRLLQIYTLEPLLLPFKVDYSQSVVQTAPRRSSSPAIALDPTRPTIAGASVLGPDTIHQINYGQLLTRKHSRPSTLGELLPSVPRGLAGWLSSRPCHLRARTCIRFLLATTVQCSVLVGQIYARLGEIFSLPSDYPQLTSVVSHSLISQYVTFYNCIWLILNDIIIGWAVGAVICEHAPLIAQVLDERIRILLIDDLQWTLLWLNNWPAGLKLNSELSQFYCHLLLGAVTGWNRVLEAFLLPYLPHLIYTAGVIGCGGVTLTISMFFDLLSLTTAHIYLCYHFSRFVYRRQLDIASSLWNLFRGRRFNVLRHRVDSWSYDLDQLLLGTILFTLTAFIFPTTFVYYALFATSQLVTFLIGALLNVALVLVNGFPLFALLLRVKDPSRLPGGIIVKLANTKETPPRIQNMTLPLSAIFAHYKTFWASFARTHHPLSLLGSVLKGQVMLAPARTSLNA